MSDLQTLMDKIEEYAGKQLPDDCHTLVSDYVRRVIDVAAAGLARVTAERDKAKAKAEKYDAVVSALSVADSGQYRNDTIETVIDYARKLAAAQKRIERINQLPAKWEKDAGREWGDAEDDERAYRIMRCRNDLLKALKDG